jgi:glycosyltransferase involved in cell wall biosynthesis
MESPPLITVICTCYNQGPYVVKALESVHGQNHKEIQLIIIDNGSKDGSREIIENWLLKTPIEIEVITFFYPEKRNYCRVFNLALERADGKYLADLAADDFYDPHHLENAIAKLEETRAGACFSNANLLKENGDSDTFYPVDKNGKTLSVVEQGDVYELLVRKYAICTATLVFNLNYVVQEGGYDEDLSYEDFDIIIRLSRKYPFVYHDAIGVTKRLLKTSLSASQYVAGHSTMLPSTLRVCEKIKQMNKSEGEHKALRFRVLHESKHALLSANFDIAGKFLDLAAQLGADKGCFKLYKLWFRSKLNLSAYYTLWRKMKH